MGKGFGIAALIFAIIAIFVPLFGIFISAFAIVLAVIAALAKDRVFATAVPLIAGVNTFFLSPTVWPTLLAEATQNGMTSQSLTAIIWSFLAAPFVVMALDGVMTTEPKAVSVGA